MYALNVNIIVNDHYNKNVSSKIDQIKKNQFKYFVCVLDYSIGDYLCVQQVHVI